ncbi:MAG TPA: SGNH/GDSL hydrolase family protein, partial [Polyangia bacterium]|nr:SGNH/GDSL hydrolase family protein [Polyangia bacterium]
RRWVASWAASPQVADSPLRVDGQTLRQIVRISLGGERVRVRLSNAHGTTPLTIGAAHLAFSRAGAAIVTGSDRALTFDGAAGVTIPPGALVVSDALPLPVAASSDLAVSLYFPGAQAITTEHATAEQTSYLSLSDRSSSLAGGDVSGAESFRAAGTSESWFVLSGVDVETTPNAELVVAFGDSITDGMESTTGANHRWPDFFAARLQAVEHGPPRAVVNAGISGNALLRELGGPSALARLDRDVFVQPGVKFVVVLLGINDIITPPEPHATAPSAAQLIAAHRQIIDRAHALGLVVFGGTIMPFDGTRLFTPAGEAERSAVNQWIRTSGAYDAVIDFDAAMRDPQRPTFLAPPFDSGDHLHPNDAGYKAMADAIDLRLFADR